MSHAIDATWYVIYAHKSHPRKPGTLIHAVVRVRHCGPQRFLPATVCDLRQLHFSQSCSENTARRFRKQACISDSWLVRP